jgi:hypothetical protein
MLYEKIIALYPELTNSDFSPFSGTIQLRNDSDGKGDYIKEWNHPTLAKPTDEQLAALGLTQDEVKALVG